MISWKIRIFQVNFKLSFLNGMFLHERHEHGATFHQQTGLATQRHWTRKGLLEKAQVGWNRLFNMSYQSAVLAAVCWGGSITRALIHWWKKIETELNIKDNTFQPPPWWTDATCSTSVFSSPCPTSPILCQPVLKQGFCTHTPCRHSFMHMS